MADEKTIRCTICGAEIGPEEGAVKGVCPRCLLRGAAQAMGGQEALEVDTESETVADLRSPEERSHSSSARGSSGGSGGTGADAGANPENLERLSGEVIDNYKLLEKLGESGFGMVYLAEQTEPVRRRVAFKLIKPGMDSREVVARFEAERQALALMDHPNVVKVYDGRIAGQALIRWFSQR